MASAAVGPEAWLGDGPPPAGDETESGGERGDSGDAQHVSGHASILALLAGRALTRARGPPLGRAGCYSRRWARRGAGTRAASCRRRYTPCDAPDRGVLRLARRRHDPAYAEAAAALGRALARRGCELVYGGAHVGLMGIAADAALARGGRVTGVIPASMVERELAHRGITDLRIVGSMHERKALMASLADAFLVLPGGMGTLDELCEILTWAQLGIHAKPVGLLDVRGYWTRLPGVPRHRRRRRVPAGRRSRRLTCDDDVDALIDALLAAAWSRREGVRLTRSCG